MTALIVTFSNDNESIPLVIKEIEARGEKAFRFDTDRFPTEVKLDIYSGDTERVIITDGEQQLDLSEVSAVWYRRMRYGHQIPNSMDKQYRDASIQECRVTVRGMIASLGGFHLDKMFNVDRANNKQLQLQTAQKIGLLTPRTLTTNNPTAVKQFAKECPQGIVTKMLSSFAIYDEQGRENVVFTTPMTEDDLEDMEGLRFCPMTFQENVPKALELRTTIVGHRVFTAAVDSQSLEGSTFDWRKEGKALVKNWQPYNLPEDIEKKLLTLMAEFGLNYGAIDIIVTPDNRYVFLEVNPVGEFFWMEVYSPHYPISQAIAEILLTQK
ncbi:MvdD family ATP-grasp ribosomal peptide maturase [Nostoc sp. FACHB-87]|uniref:MvdD family ATP-grasp ribosomal peptide maturase n=1 Tax=Nostocales TaxID=1161 RepID=UPI00168752D3|nr:MULTISPECIES: MvdD family ATP-grasp ribosomal peptide maturase [Nostocales]MBD2299204.1 MvdD family ATP-grasp ribosomal peptide maturase [Nostoc sp. FACHB-190]MBD2454621.1 MvdD family ATP-grasp ribosomal peptide maturase [Nostoc sp. FACHB-87]MBD2476334.1 MvdD family ATP-grasp ribosomal peptide maturase [Anabaena sp. FACHB-83]MBD2488279.1 MvdD family ATP-grasp ribosomal peptide maturase [Aulosira sp. FACHB-615]